jgi:3-dehydroquinate synthase
MTSLTVHHRRGSYPVRFASLKEALESLPESAFLFTDRNVLRAWAKALPRSLHRMVFNPGEESKSLAQFEAGLRWLSAAGADRASTAIALGGGVVGDLAGFVAACFMRGVPYVQIPTSLLAQVDSSVGGKVGVDLPEGKNMAGAFHPPTEVWICLETLTTLPERQFANGMAEVWKCGFILDAELASRLERVVLTPQSDDLADVVRRCIELKTAVVEADEEDRTGARAILNFGHTVGHAIEQHSGYKLLHGEAISVGMVAEAELGERLGITEKGTSGRIRTDLASAGLPTTYAKIQSPALLELMQRDKKAERGEMAFSLITRVGECKLVRAVPRMEVEAALSAL